MPVVIPASPGATSAAQTLPALQVFDYLYMAGDPTSTTAKPVPNAEVQITLQYDRATSQSPTTYMVPSTVVVKTDSNGYWSAYLVPNDALSPLNTFYTVQTPYFAYQISVPSGGGPYKSSSILANAVSTLPPATTNVVGPLSVAGLLTAQAGLTVSAGDLTVSTGNLALSLGGFSMAGPLTLTAAASRLVPGATSFAVRDNANVNDNLLVSNAGAATVRNGLTVTAGGLTVTAGGLTVTAGGLTVSAGATSVAALTASGLLTAQNAATVSAGDLTVTAGRLLMSASAGRIVGGSSSLSHRNNADSADNLLIADAGAVTLRNALSLPPSAGGSVAASSYGSVTVKIAETVVSSNQASVTFSSIPGGFRHLRLVWRARGSDAAAQVFNVQFNGDTGANYTTQVTTYTGVTIATSQAVGTTSARVGVISDSSQTIHSTGYLYLPDYTLASAAHVFHSYNGRNDATAFGGEQAIIRWGTAAITSITLTPAVGNIALGVFTLYGEP